MFDVSFGELLLIAVVALVVLGPERLPGAARTAGALLRRVRRGWDSVRAEVMRELEAEELRGKLKEAQEAVRGTADDLRAHVHAASDTVGNAALQARDVMRPLPAQDESHSADGVPTQPGSRAGDGDDHA